MTQLSPTALEMVARSVFSARGWPDAVHPAFEHEQEDWEACATAAITAYLAQAEKEGWVMVPKDPSPNMRFAGADYLLSQKRFVTASDMWPTWKVMLAAAQNGVSDANS